MSKITDAMTNTLKLAYKQELRRVHDDKPGKPPWPAHPATLNALVDRGYLARTERRTRRDWPVTIWTITDSGRDALAPPEKHITIRPRYLARGSVYFRKLANGKWAVDDKRASGDYSTDPRKSIDRDQSPNSRTTTAIPVLIDDTHLEHFAAKARDNERKREKQRADELAKQPIQTRIQRVNRMAQQQHTTVHRDLRLITHMIDNGRQNDASRHLRRLESSLERRAA